MPFAKVFNPPPPGGRAQTSSTRQYPRTRLLGASRRGFVVVTVVIVPRRRSYARLGSMFCLNEGRDETRERDRRRRERGGPGNLPSAILGPIVLEPRRHRDEEPLCEGPNALVVPRLPASPLCSIKRLLIDPSIDASMAAALPGRIPHIAGRL